MAVRRSATIHRLTRPSTFTAAEDVIEHLSNRIMSCGMTYKQIAEDTNLSPSTIRGVGSRKTKWPRPVTFFALLGYFKIKLKLE